MSRRPTVGLVVVGDELLSGAVGDVNGPYLIGRMRALGARVRRVAVVGDEVDEIAEVVASTSRACDLICTAGGVGPTHDDVTIEGVARALGVPVEEDPRIVAWMRRRLGREPGPEHRRMARVPRGAELVTPAGGPAAGAPPTLVVGPVVLLPGVPSLLRACFALVEDRFRGAPWWQQALEVAAPEPSLAERLREIAAAHPRVRVGSYPRQEAGAEGRWIVRLTVEGEALADVRAAARGLAEAFAGLRPTLGPAGPLGSPADPGGDGD